MPKIMEIPKNERPREKMFRGGSGTLSNQELLAILIGSGTKDESSLAIASRLLSQSEYGIRYLSSACPEELMLISGIGESIACRIAATVELGKRLAMSRADDSICFESPDDIAALFMEEMRYLKQEAFKILLINSRGESMGKELISMGGLTKSMADPRDIFRIAIKRGAASIVLVHNHPSGNPTPSGLDVEATLKIIESGKLLGIQVVDHIVIGDGNYISMRRKKLI